jgi:feruloyl-CoA synthase
MELFADPRITGEERADGTFVLESADPLGDSAVAVTEWVRRWAEIDPDHPVLAERGRDGAWQRRTYGEAHAAASAIGQALLDRGLSAERPLLVLSGNSIGHLEMMLGAMTAGVPVVPVSVAYSLQSKDHARIAMIGELVTPGAVYVEDADPFAPAIAALGGHPVVLARSIMDELKATTPGLAVEAARRQVTGDTIAKLLFTSGSTGSPKGVITTQRMLCANQQMSRPPTELPRNLGDL